MKKYLILLFFVFLGIQASTANAQLELQRSGIPSENLTISTYPEYPGPFQEVVVSASTYWFDLNLAEITWNVNGQILEKGQGKDRLSVQLGNIGEKTNITITVKKPNGTTFTNTTTLYPSLTNIVWEARTYTPPFYKGKALPTYGSEIVVNALPTIQVGNTPINKEKLEYFWTLNGTPMENNSGLGKNSIQFPATITRKEERVEVLVKVPNTSIGSYAEYSIKISQPDVQIYEDHPLFGMMSQSALSQSSKLSNKEVVLRAVPFFFSTKDPAIPKIVYTWSMNGKGIPDVSSDTITLRREEDQGGIAKMGLQIEHQDNTLQFGMKNFTLQFGNNE